MADQKKSSSERVKDVFGDDVARPPKLSNAILSKVVKEMAEERAKQAEAAAKVVLTKLAELETQQARALNAFNKANKAIEKEKLKVLAQVEAGLKNAEPPSEEVDLEDDKDEAKPEE